MIDTGRSVRAVATELTVEENTLSKWVRDERRRLGSLSASSDIPLTVAERAELLRLRRQVAEQEFDSLGKLVSCSAANQAFGSRHEGTEANDRA